MFEAMGQLFRDLGYSRKACFYYRLAAMHSVKQAVTSPNWNKAKINTQLKLLIN